MTLDAADLRLLAALQADGAATNAVLAATVNLSASQVSRRRQALEQAGVIRGYRAVLDRSALGLELVVFVHVLMASHSADNAGRFAALVAHRPEVVEAWAVTGESDYLLKVVVPGLSALSALVNDVLLPHPTVARVRSEVVLTALKEDARLPIPDVG